MAGRHLSALALALLLTASSAAAEAPPLWAGLAPGPHPVGFTVLAARDSARAQPDGRGRPVQVSVWYPSRGDARTPAAALRYADYVLVAAGEQTLVEPTGAGKPAARAEYTGFLARQGVPEAGIAAWMEAPLLARRDAPAARGRFPLVLLAQGMGGAVQDQAVLGEFLASNGFVVATCPSPVRLGARMESDADVLPVAEAESQDLAFATASIAKRRLADTSRIGIVGYSFGARAGLLLAARQPAARALVSLDGGIGTASGGGWLSAAALDRAAFRVPLLHVYEEMDEAMRPDFTLLDSLTGSAQTRVKVDGLHHMDLITFGFASAALPEMGLPAGDRAALAGRLAETFAHALRFLQAKLGP